VGDPAVTLGMLIDILARERRRPQSAANCSRMAAELSAKRSAIVAGVRATPSVTATSAAARVDAERRQFQGASPTPGMEMPTLVPRVPRRTRRLVSWRRFHIIDDPYLRTAPVGGRDLTFVRFMCACCAGGARRVSSRPALRTS
jgi:hypothetical protein